MAHQQAHGRSAAGRCAKELIAAWDIDRQDMTALLLARLDAVFKAALAAGNHNAALGAISAAARIAQL